jgi:glycosyltransferase involved in cell wall biosynthesis
MTWKPDGAGSGVDRVYAALSRALPHHNVAFEGLALGAPSSANVPDGIHAVSSTDASLSHRLQALRRKTQRVLQSSPPDLVATHFSLYTLPLLDLVPPRPLVVHFHGPWALESQEEGESWMSVQAKHWIERQVYRRGTRFIVLSEAFRDVLSTRYRIDPERIHIVPGGVDLERFNPPESRRAARVRLGWDPDRPTLLSVRRLVRRVGLAPLIDAMKHVRAFIPEAQLLIAGKGPLAGALQDRIRAHGLDDTVRLLGFVPEADLPLAYRAADCSVVPTQALEGFGLVAAESLATGTPAVVTPVGGLPEVVRPLNADLVMARSTPEAMAARLIGVLRGAIPVPSAAACRRYAAEHFDWSVVARRIRSVYETTLSSTTPH